MSGQVFFCSIHLHDGAFYPRSGARGKPSRNVMNLPIRPLWHRKSPRRAEAGIPARRSKKAWGRHAFRQAVTEKLLPALLRYNPDLLMRVMNCVRIAICRRPRTEAQVCLG